MKKIKILTVIYHYHPFMAGAENMTKYLVQATNNGQFENNVLTIATLPLEKKYGKLKTKEKMDEGYLINRIRHLRMMGLEFNGRYGRYLMMVWMIWQIIMHGRKADIIHAHTYHMPAFCSVIAGKILRKKVVITGHNMVSRLKREIVEKVSPNIYLRCLKSATVYVAISKEIYKEAIEIAGIKKNSLCTIYNGIDLEKFQRPEIDKHRSKLRVKLGLPQGKRIIIYTGRLHSTKNVKTLIEATYKISKEHKDILTVIVGDGPQKRELIELTKSLGADKYILFAGFKTNPQDYLQCSDIYCLPSFREGFSLALLEGMASENLCVASNIPGNNEALEHGIDGVLFNPENTDELISALQQVLKNEIDLKSMIQAAKNKVRSKFSLQVMVEKYQRLYRSLN